MRWRNPFSRNKRDPPDFHEQLAATSEEERISRELHEPPAQIPFDTKLLDDAKLDMLFQPYDPKNGMGNPYAFCFLPLLPWSSRLLSSCSFTESEIIDLEFDLDADAEECHRIGSGSDPPAPEEVHVAIDSLSNVIKWKIRGHARHGVLLRAMTTYRKVLQITRGEEGKKGGLRR